MQSCLHLKSTVVKLNPIWLYANVLAMSICVDIKFTYNLVTYNAIYSVLQSRNVFYVGLCRVGYFATRTLEVNTRPDPIPDPKRLKHDFHKVYLSYILLDML